MAIPNRSINPVVASCFANVVQYGGAVGDRFGLAPWPKLVSERVHIGIGAYSRIAKQVPGPAHGVSALQNGKALRRALRLEVIRRANPRETRAHDQYVKVPDTPGFLIGRG